MPRYWESERYDDHWQVQASMIDSNLNFLYELNRAMAQYGCTEQQMAERVKWLKDQFQELQMYRSLNDGSLVDIIGQFKDVMKRHIRMVPSDGIDALQFALRQLLEYEALREHLQQCRIYVPYEMIFPEEEGDDGSSGT